MANKTLLERLEADAKRHRVPQIEILPAWVKSGEKGVATARPIVVTATPELEKSLEKPKKADKKAKKKKK